MHKAHLEIAARDLPERMGHEYTEIVMTCLQRVNEFGKLEENLDASKIISTHNDWVIQPLERLYSEAAFIGSGDEASSLPAPNDGPGSY